MRSLLRAAAVASSLTLLALGVWQAQVQAQDEGKIVGGVSGVMSESDKGTLHLPSPAMQVVPERERAAAQPMKSTMMSGSKALGRPVFGDAGWAGWLPSRKAPNSAPQAIHAVAGSEGTGGEARPGFALVIPEEKREVLFQQRVFQGDISLPQLPPVKAFGLLPRLAEQSVLREDVEGAQTFLGVMPGTATTSGWHEPAAYSQGLNPYLFFPPAWQQEYERAVWLGAVVSGSRAYHCSISVWAGRKRALAADFQRLTQGPDNGHMFLSPIIFDDGQ